MSALSFNLCLEYVENVKQWSRLTAFMMPHVLTDNAHHS